MSARMTIGLTFFHGWGLSPRFWQPLAALLQAYPQTSWDAGYFDAPQVPDFNGATRWVAVGHSMGLIHALEQPPHNGWAAMVSLCGFTRFCAQQAGEAGQPKRVVERMLRAFNRSPDEVLHDFLDRCALSTLHPANGIGHGDPIQSDRLRTDLSRLATVDASDLMSQVSVPVLALASRDDMIVPAALTESTFGQRPNTQLAWHEQGGHALGHDQAGVCAQAIQAFLTTLDDGQRTHQP